jgi:hypothetical protein
MWISKTFLKSLFLIAVFTVLANLQINAQPFYDYDRKADLGVFRPTENVWYGLSSETQASSAVSWGLSSDQLVPADYDGDGLTDIAVWRADSGVWYIKKSRDGEMQAIQWGTRMFIPNGYVADEPVPADYDGDGQADIAVWRPATGTWYVLESSKYFNPAKAVYFRWGKLGDIPVPADYDGDGKADFAIFRSTEDRWYVYQSASKTWKTANFGRSGYDQLVPADYTGDDKADFAVYRAGSWHIQDSATNEVYTFQFGLATDIPVPADYNGDGLTDLAVFRSGVWYVLEPLVNRTTTYFYGLDGDIPVNSLGVKPSIVGIP